MAKKSSRENKKRGESVEQNISDSYIPKSKLGDLPIQNPLESDMQKKMDEMKNNLEKFKKESITKFKFIEAIGLIPQQANKKIEEEYEISEEDSKKELIHVLTIIPEDKFKEIQKIKLELIKIAKSIDSNIWVHLMTPVDMWNLCLDSKFEVAEALAMSYPILDKGILGGIRVAQIHKSLVLKKFEKYVTSYVFAGSLARGEAKPTSDVDIFVVIDDTDVKRMPRLELKEKLRAIIFQYIQEATALAGVKNILNVQTYLLTEFWEAVKDAQPVMFTFIRDGIPLYDRGAFLPWKQLLRMGKIKPSPEALDIFMSSGDRLAESVDRRLLDILMIDIYWGVLTPTQGVLMLYGLAPPTHKETVELFKETFVTKEKLIEQKYADILHEVVIKYFKGYEHGKIKKISGTDLDIIYKKSLDYIKRLKDLRKQIEVRVQENLIKSVYEETFGMVGALIDKKEEKEILKEFEKQMVKTGKFPKKFLENLEFIAKTKKGILEEKKNPKTKKDPKGKKKVDIMTGKEINHVDQARKLGQEIVDTLIEYNQRCDLNSLNKSRFLIDNGKRKAELFFLKETFIIEEGIVKKVSENSLKESNIEELNKALEEHKNKPVSISYKDIEILKKEFKNFNLKY